MKRPDATPRARRRGVVLVPAILTLANIFLGYFAIVKCFEGAYGTAAALLVVAAVLDKLDGTIARATRTVSDFGGELDSLADVISFGVAPALLAYSWGLSLLGKVGWSVAFFFLMCGALRLARFNTRPASTDGKYFVGLPIPMAAAMPVTIVLLRSTVGGASEPLTEVAHAWPFAAIVALPSFLMVSRVKYLSFKDVSFRRDPRVFVALGGMIAAIAAWTGPVLVALSVAYVAHGPALRVLAWRNRKDLHLPDTVAPPAPEDASPVDVSP